MNINKAHNASIFLNYIEEIKNKQIELIRVKEKIVEILIGHTEIPDTKIYDVYRSIDELSKHLDSTIDENYKLIEKL